MMLNQSPAAPATPPPALPEPEGHPSGRPARASSAELLRGAREIEILHGDALYRLRVTAQGKLILTK
jgi:hemin uptake protein HemP